jgi:hypothetical protein
MKEDRNGNIWLGTSWGLVRARIPKDDPPPEADSRLFTIGILPYHLLAPLNEIYDPSPLGGTAMVVASDSGPIFLNLVRCELSRREFDDPIAGPLNSDMMYCIGQGFRGQLRVGTMNNGAFMVEWQTERVVNCSWEPAIGYQLDDEQCSGSVRAPSTPPLRAHGQHSLCDPFSFAPRPCHLYCAFDSRLTLN